MNKPKQTERKPVFSLRLLLAAVTLMLGSCSSDDDFLKARPARPAGFLSNPTKMNPHPIESPFHYAAHSKSWQVHERARSKAQIYIAPVDTSRLRGIQHGLARTSYNVRGQERPVAELARRTRLEFAQAFVDSPSPSYEVVGAPGPDSVTLELALIELDPTSVGGNAAKKIGTYLLSPLVSVASYGTTSGSIAIEGKIVCSDTGEIVFQFADREADRLSLFSVKDFEPYGHIEDIISEWAKQFELFSRTPAQHEVGDSSWFTLNPF